MKVEKIFFREMYHQICLLNGAGVVESVNLRDVFDFPPDEKLDGWLTYGCIDAGAGFTFEILAGARLDGERIKIFPASYKKSVKLRRGAMSDTDLKILTAQYSLAFRDRIQMINDAYSVDAAREQTRLIKTLDAFRHPNYPDDVAVYFLSNEHKTELLWVRCAAVDENILTGELLNEPHQNFGCHLGEAIKFGVAQVNGQNILLHLPTK